jgi:tetrahydrodipicolinate N-succinyltransferase
VGEGVIVGGRGVEVGTGVAVQTDAVMVATCSGDGPQAETKVKRKIPPRIKTKRFMCSSFGKERI